MVAKKIIAIAGSLLILLGASPVFALTDAERQLLIQSILQQIAILQARIEDLPPDRGSGLSFCHTFAVNMSLGASGNEAVALNQALALQGFFTDTIPPNNSYFSEKTRIAVLAFQQRYSHEILAPLGLVNATGNVRSATRAKLNQLYGCPPLRFVYPRSGETVRVGETVRITWEASGLGQKDTLTLTVFSVTDPFTNVKTLTTSVLANKGFYDWKISSGNLPSNSYPLGVRIKTQVNKKNISAESDTFAVNSSSGDENSNIELRYPDGNDQLHVGETVRITWRSKGLTSSDKVKIAVSSASALNLNVKTIASSVSAAQGYYDWKISNTNIPSADLPEQVAIKIEVVNKSISDSVWVTIGTAASQENASISISYPTSHQIFNFNTRTNVGDDPRVEWTSSGFISSDRLKITVHLESDKNLNVKTITTSVPALQGYYDWNISDATLPNNAVGSQRIFLTIESTAKDISKSSDVFVVDVTDL